MMHCKETDPMFMPRMQAWQEGRPLGDGSHWDEEWKAENTWYNDSEYKTDLPENPKAKEKDDLFDKMWNESEVDIYGPPPKQRVAIDIQHNFHGTVPFGTYGGISCIYGPPKSKKSFLKSAFVSAYIGGQTNNRFDIVRGRDRKGRWVVDIDTEQGDYHAWRTLKRVKDMVGADRVHNYKPLAWAGYSPKEMRDGLREILSRNDLDIGLVVIDGIHDFVESVNDDRGTNELFHILVSAAKETGAHILCIMHCNYGSKKPTGHLGSSMLKKAETIAYVENKTRRGSNNDILEINKKVMTVECMDSRSISFDSFEFVIDEMELPRFSGWIEEENSPF